MSTAQEPAGPAPPRRRVVEWSDPLAAAGTPCLVFDLPVRPDRT